MKKTTPLLLFILVLLEALSAQAKQISLIGAGATFPYPFYSKIFQIYYKYAGVKVNYQAIGSGGGIRQLMGKLVDFGATDAFVDDNLMKKFNSPIVHIPTVAGAVVITYNLPGDPKIKLTAELIAEIFLGKIKKWNDPKIAQVNPEIKLPNMKIVVIHRSDGSGTTFIFSDYLCKTNEQWRKEVGKGKSLNWKVGLGAKGNPGVAGLIRQIPGSIGYTELIYALSNNMTCARIQNKAGNFIDPSLNSITAATEVKLPDDMRISLVNTGNPKAYPICGFTWIIVYKDLADGNLSFEKAKALVKLLWWITHQGQKYAQELHYSKLSKQAQEKVEKIISSITYKGQRLWE